MLRSTRRKIYGGLFKSWLSTRGRFRYALWKGLGPIVWPGGLFNYVFDRDEEATVGWSRYLVEVLLKYKDSEALLADLDERFPRKCAQYGLRRAHFWYFCQVVISIRPLAWALVVTTWEAFCRIAK